MNKRNDFIHLYLLKYGDNYTYLLTSLHSMFVDSSHQTHQFEKNTLLTTTVFEHTSPLLFTPTPLLFTPTPLLFTPTPLFPLLYIVQQVYFSNFYVSILCFLIHHIRHINLKKNTFLTTTGFEHTSCYFHPYPSTFTPTPLFPLLEKQKN